jgi:hypothetical protein
MQEAALFEFKPSDIFIIIQEGCMIGKITRIGKDVTTIFTEDNKVVEVNSLFLPVKYKLGDSVELEDLEQAIRDWLLGTSLSQVKVPPYSLDERDSTRLYELDPCPVGIGNVAVVASRFADVDRTLRVDNEWKSRAATLLLQRLPS